MASEKDIQDVINTLIAEGIGEGEEGMRRIAETILNRGEQRGLTPAQVVRERAQYTGYSNPGPAALRAQQDPASISAAQAAWQLAQGPDDPTGGANHYWNPNIVNPSWAGGMTQLGTFGNHAFATDRPVPPRDIPVPPRVAPIPASVEDRVTARNTAPVQPSALQTALDQYALRERNRVTPASVEDRVTARNSATARTDALKEATRRAALTANQSYAGQDRAPSRPSFNGDPLTPATGPVVATIPTRPQTALQAASIGAPPSTRPVPTTRVGNSANNINQQRSEQAAQRSQSAPVSRGGSDPIGSMPTLAELQATLGRPLAASQVASLYKNTLPDPKGELAFTGTAKNNAGMSVATLLDTVDPMTGKRSTAPSVLPAIKSAPVPFMRPAPVLVAGPAPVQRSAPVPFNRPSFAPLGAQATVPRSPAALPAPAPLRITVQGANPIPYPQQRPTFAPPPVMQLSPADYLQRGSDAVNQSGDTSSGNQYEAAQARASGEGGRNRRY